MGNVTKGVSNGEQGTPQPEDFICLAMSGEGFICNLKPKHDGPHQARATSYHDYGRIVAEWPTGGHNGGLVPDGKAASDG